MNDGIERQPTDVASGFRIVRGEGMLESGSGGRSGAMVRSTAVSAGGVWLGVSTLAPHHKSARHHHGDQTTIVFLVRGSCGFVVGEDGAVYRAHAGDIAVIPPFVVHLEDNDSDDETLAVVVRTGEDPKVINLE